MALELRWLPPEPLLCGFELYAQLLVLDPDPPQGLDLTPGLRLRLGH